MMATEKRLIDANALMKAIRSFRWFGVPNTLKLMFDYLEIIINEQSTVDAVEVKHGHNLRDHDSAFECSVCGWEDWDTLTADTSEYNYCPNCGADMRERKDND